MGRPRIQTITDRKEFDTFMEEARLRHVPWIEVRYCPDFLPETPWVVNGNGRRTTAASLSKAIDVMMPTGSRTFFNEVRVVDLRTLEPADISWGEICDSLELIYRWAGRLGPISVAQHSVQTANLVAEMGGSLRAVLFGLLHDFHEAFIGEVPRAAKSRVLDVEMSNLVTHLDATFRLRLGVSAPTEDELALVKEADGASAELELLGHADEYVPGTLREMVGEFEAMIGRGELS